MKVRSIALCAALGVGVGALGAAAQEGRVIQPSPAYYQHQGASSAPPAPAVGPRAVAPQPAAAVAQPIPARMAPVQQAPRPLATQPKPLSTQPRPVQARPTSVGQPKPLAAQPKPLAVQPRAAAQPVSPPAQMRPLATQPKPLAVQPRPVQARPVQMVPVQAVAQPVRPPMPVQMPTGTITEQPARVAAPVPVPVPVRSAMPQGQVAAPVEPVAFPAPSAPTYEPAAYEAPAPAGQPGTRLYLVEIPDAQPAWDVEGGGEDEGYEWPGISIGPKIGTTGVGGDVTLGLASFLNLRSGVNYASFGWKQKFGDVKYDTEMDMLSVPLLVDLYPGGGHFRITGGAYVQPGTELSLSATPGSAVQIGHHTYAPDVVGTLSGDVELSSMFTPYLGIGFGNTVGEDQWLTFSLDLGVVYQPYDVTLTSNGAGMTTKLDTFREDMKLEQKNLEKDMENYQFFPVLTLGVAYHF